MINLIPPSAKRSLKFEYWVRVFSVWLIIWSVALFIGACFMFPTYVLIGSQISATAEEAELAQENVESFNLVSRDLVRASQQAKFAVDELTLPKISAYQTLLKQFEGQGIEVENISINRSEEETGIAPISVNGVAVDRRALAEFRDRLVANEAIEEVELPIANLAQDRNISFSLSVVINNEVEI